MIGERWFLNVWTDKILARRSGGWEGAAKLRVKRTMDS